MRKATCTLEKKGKIVYKIWLDAAYIYVCVCVCVQAGIIHNSTLSRKATCDISVQSCANSRKIWLDVRMEVEGSKLKVDLECRSRYH